MYPSLETPVLNRRDNLIDFVYFILQRVFKNKNKKNLAYNFITLFMRNVISQK